MAEHQEETYRNCIEKNFEIYPLSVQKKFNKLAKLICTARQSLGATTTKKSAKEKQREYRFLMLRKMYLEVAGRFYSASYDASPDDYQQGFHEMEEDDLRIVCGVEPKEIKPSYYKPDSYPTVKAQGILRQISFSPRGAEIATDNFMQWLDEIEAACDRAWRGLIEQFMTPEQRDDWRFVDRESKKPVRSLSELAVLAGLDKVVLREKVQTLAAEIGERRRALVEKQWQSPRIQAIVAKKGRMERTSQDQNVAQDASSGKQHHAALANTPEVAFTGSPSNATPIRKRASRTMAELEKLHYLIEEAVDETYFTKSLTKKKAIVLVASYINSETESDEWSEEVVALRKHVTETGEQLSHGSLRGLYNRAKQKKRKR